MIILKQVTNEVQQTSKKIFFPRHFSDKNQTTSSRRVHQHITTWITTVRKEKHMWILICGFWKIQKFLQHHESGQFCCWISSTGNLFDIQKVERRQFSIKGNKAQKTFFITKDFLYNCCFSNGSSELDYTKCTALFWKDGFFSNNSKIWFSVLSHNERN